MNNNLFLYAKNLFALEKLFLIKQIVIKNSKKYFISFLSYVFKLTY